MIIDFIFKAEESVFIGIRAFIRISGIIWYNIYILNIAKGLGCNMFVTTVSVVSGPHTCRYRE